ncbi:hypothetical protein [Flavobacterium chilense]|uniref:Uncharacterized protein n=1 Tax=Flavobacterium chilense TaxID=946677 RepID=A0A1M6ZP74_9FLAO|nr:hypothetical protein [Flavobacterium chilense]SHL32179.1 hypothetical protein SAMN05444484_1011103 [Flavobacterium chilense]
MKNSIKLVALLFLFNNCKKETKNDFNKTDIKNEKVEKVEIQHANNDQLNNFIGDYEYKNTNNPKESLLLILKKTDIKSVPDFEGYSWEEKNEKGEVAEMTLTGFFYGNTDLFDEEREGYAPGFFVVNVQAEPLEENLLKVNVKLDTSDILSNPVEPPMTSAKEALGKGNKKWEITEMNIAKELIFEMKNSKELILKSDSALDEKIFKKTR